jgi:hypothetical protein
MKRRDFITLLGGGAAWPLTARAQQRVPVIGFLGTTSPSAWRQPIAAFERRLSELGWIAGRTITIDYRGPQRASTGDRRSLRSTQGRYHCRRRQCCGGGQASHDDLTNQASCSVYVVLEKQRPPLRRGLLSGGSVVQQDGSRASWAFAAAPLDGSALLHSRAESARGSVAICARRQRG